ncbi:MAG: ATP-binding protein [Spirochaetota bacterium]
MKIPHIYGHTRELAKLDSFIASGKMPHALLFTGPAGIGKKQAAMSFLTSLFCTAEEKPCGKCASCAQTAAGSFPDFFTAGPDENGAFLVGDPDSPEPGTARWIVQRMGMKSVSGRTAAVIDGIDRANDSAQNSLLKTIEEPGEGAILILIASERAKILPTLISRCTEIKFQALSDDIIRQIIKDKTENGDLCDFIASAAGGSAETAIALTDESFREDILDLCREISKSIVSGSALKADNAVLARPKKGADCVEILISVYHHLMRSCAKGIPPASALYDDIYIDDISSLRTIIKMLLSVKKARAHNLNAALQLKALAYFINDTELPAPPFAPQI